MEKKVILGTGLSGLVGSAIVKHLSDRFEFHNLDLTSGVNILDEQTVSKALDEHPTDCLLHLAAFTDVNAAQQQLHQKEQSCYQVNVVGTENIARQCAQRNIHLIHLSTGYVFDGLKHAPYGEDDTKNPTDWYSITKSEAEEKVIQFLPTSTILRINFPYRQDEFPKKDIWHKMATALAEGKTGPFFADHYFTLSPIEWLTKVIAWNIDHKPAGIFHATTETVYSDYTLAQEIAIHFGFQQELQASSVKVFNQTAERPYQPSLILSNRKLKDAMGDQYPHA